MPRKACTVCGAASVGRTARCPLHPLAPTVNQRRPYRGTARYRQTVAAVLERDRGVCHRCGELGADTIDHFPTPYSRLPRDRKTGHPTIDDALDEGNLRAAHLSCNRRAGNR
jgi:5-methylcytosine-specific restriction endonuclease McrA